MSIQGYIVAFEDLTRCSDVRALFRDYN